MNKTEKEILIHEVHSFDGYCMLYAKGHIDKELLLITIEEEYNETEIDYNDAKIKNIRHTYLKKMPSYNCEWDILIDVPDYIPQPGAFKATVLFLEDFLYDMPIDLKEI